MPKLMPTKRSAMSDLLPRPVLLVAVKLFRLLDYYNLLPGFFIEGDALYASAIVINLGSLQMAPGYHHLYRVGQPSSLSWWALWKSACA